MIAKLRRRLTLLLTAMTALVLGGSLFFTWRLSEKQYQSGVEELFNSNFSSVCDRLADADSITDTWLAEQERGTQCLLFLQDNGAALHYAGALESKTPRDELQTLALAGAYQTLDPSRYDSQGSVIRQEAHLSMSGNTQDFYFMAAALLPRGNDGSYLLIVSLQDKEPLAIHRWQSALQYLGVWLLGTLALMLISNWLIGKALLPTTKALRQQKEFIAAASHELRSPLAVIKASAEAVSEKLTPEQQHSLLHNIRQETDRMAHLTDDLLLLANGDLGTIPAHLQPLAPDNLCLEVYDQFYPLAKQKSHPLTLSMPEHPFSLIQADDERLRQLLGILLRNAMEHTPAGTSIHIILSGGAPKQPVSISIVDHGPGIPTESKTRIFDRFYRADASRTSKKNFGPGLSVAQELARLHGASLTVQDTPGGGATFVVRFP